MIPEIRKNTELCQIKFRKQSKMSPNEKSDNHYNK